MQTNDNGSISWTAYKGKHITVYGQKGSYAVRRAAAELRDAERAAEALEKLLEPKAEVAAGPLEIYLVDAVAGTPVPADHPLHAAMNGNGNGPRKEAGHTAFAPIVRILQPEAAEEPVAYPVMRRLLSRWFGADPERVRVMVEGIGGVVAGRTGAGPTLKEAQQWMREQLEQGKQPTVFGQPESASPPGDGVAARPDAAPDSSFGSAATSFVGYLIEQYGAPTLRQFWAAYDPQRSDQAYLAAYQKPLGALEESWLWDLKKDQRGSTAYRAFFRQIVPLIRPYWLRQAEVFLYLLFSLAYGLILPLATRYLIDTIIPQGDLNGLLVFIVVIFGLYVLNSLIAMRRSYISSWINQMILRSLQSKMFAHLQRLSHNYYGHAKVGDIITRLSSDLQIVQGAMASVVNTGLYMTISGIAAGVAMMLLSWELGVLVLLVLPIFIFAYLAMRTRLQKASYARQEISGGVASMVQESLTAHAVVKALASKSPRRPGSRRCSIPSSKPGCAWS